MHLRQVVDQYVAGLRRALVQVVVGLHRVPVHNAVGLRRFLVQGTVGVRQVLVQVAAALSAARAVFGPSFCRAQVAGGGVLLSGGGVLGSIGLNLEVTFLGQAWTDQDDDSGTSVDWWCSAGPCDVSVD